MTHPESPSFNIECPCAIPGLPQGQVAGARIFQVIERQPLIEIDSEEGEVPPADAPIKGELELKEVSFTYPARPDLQIFTNFNLRIPAGNSFFF
jgi:ATP-binding cassette subfamily B (MDR/TAP) protein 1